MGLCPSGRHEHLLLLNGVDSGVDQLLMALLILAEVLASGAEARRLRALDLKTLRHCQALPPLAALA